MKKVVIAIIIILVLGSIGVTIYFATDTDESSFGNGNGEKSEGFWGEKLNGSRTQELTEEQISEIQEFFDSNPTNTEISDYCQESRICEYYCAQINQNHEYCENRISQKNFDRGMRE